MASIDKAAIVFSIAIALVGVGIAAMGSAVDNSPATPTQQMSANTDAVEAKAAADAAAVPQTHIVETAMGSGAPGCETSNACYLPQDITISTGDTVQWDNVDTAAHTVSGGSPADGPSGVFDSSLLMAGLDYSFTFNDAGNYDYFCMVHPWMVGSVTVN